MGLDASIQNYENSPGDVGSPGNPVDTLAGIFSIPAGESSIVWHNSLFTSDSLVQVSPPYNSNATATAIVRIERDNGKCTFHANATATTNAVTFGFILISDTSEQ